MVVIGVCEAWGGLGGDWETALRAVGVWGGYAGAAMGAGGALRPWRYGVRGRM